MPEGEQRLRAASAARASAPGVVIAHTGGFVGYASDRAPRDHDLVRFGTLLELAGQPGEARTARELQEVLGGSWESPQSGSGRLDVAAEAYTHAVQAGLDPDQLRTAIDEDADGRYGSYDLNDAEVRKASGVDETVAMYEDRWNQELAQTIVNPTADE